MKLKSIIVCLISLNVGASELSSFIKLSYENDPEIKKILNDKKTLEYYVDQGLKGDETTLTVESETGYVSDQDDNNTSFDVGVSKNILKTGTDISIGHSKFFNPREEGTTTSVKLEQSLLKNSFGKANRLKLDSLNLEKGMKELESAELLEDYLLVIINKYLQFKKSLTSLKLAQSQHQEAIKMFKNLESKYKSKVATIADLNRGELLLLNREENIIEKKEKNKQYELELLKVTGKAGLKLNSNQSVDLLLAKMIKLYQNKKNKINKESVRSFIIAKNNIDIANKNINYAQDQEGSSLNLVVGYNQHDTTQFSTITQQDETVVGFSYSIPIGDNQAKANTKIARIEKLSLDYKKVKLNNEFDISLSEIENNLTTLKSKLYLNNKKIKLTKSLIKEQGKRYSIGQVSFDDFIQLKYDFFDLENENIEIKIDYLNTILNWFSLTDNLIGIERLL